jgi:hypothetical protein
MTQLRMYSDQRGASAVYESGFSWLAALCPPVWYLQQHLYGLALVSLVECTAVQALLALSSLSQTWQWILYILHLAANGFVARPIQRWLLERGGWFVTAEEPMRAPKAQA